MVRTVTPTTESFRDNAKSPQLAEWETDLSRPFARSLATARIGGEFLTSGMKKKEIRLATRSKLPETRNVGILPNAKATTPPIAGPNAKAANSAPSTRPYGFPSSSVAAMSPV